MTLQAALRGLNFAYEGMRTLIEYAADRFRAGVREPGVKEGV